MAFRKMCADPARETYLNDGWQEYLRLVDTKGSPKHTDAVGLLGAFLFVTLAERSRQTNPPTWQLPSSATSLTDKKAAEYILAKPVVNDFIYHMYDVDERDVRFLKGSDVELHRIGTTSFILRVKPRGLTASNDWAFKIVKPWFLDIATIEERTEQYKQRYGDLPHAPKVVESKKAFIMMDFVEGRTLKECLADSKWKKRLRSEPRLLGSLAKCICQMLEKYSGRDKPLAHGDISLDNILVKKDPVSGSEWELMFVDFGPNYMLTEKVVPLESYLATQASVAPEFRTGQPYEPTIEGDLYSLGRLLLEAWLGEQPEEPLDTGELLDGLYRSYLGSAAIIDDLIEKDPDVRKRAAARPRTQESPSRESVTDEKLYENLGDRFERAAKAEQRNTDFGRQTWGQVATKALSFLGVGFLLQFWLRNKYGLDLERAKGNILFAVALVSAATSLVGLLALIDVIRRMFPSIGDSPGALAGQLVAITSLFVAVKYYDIFSGLSPGRDYWIAEITMRLNSLPYLVPFGIMWIWPSTWPLVYSIAMLAMVVPNNYACHRLIIKTKESPKVQLTADMRYVDRRLSVW